MAACLYQPFPMAGRRRAQAWRHQPAYRRPRHFHAEPEFNLVVHGTARFTVGEQVVPAGPGALLWFPPGLDHYLADASPDLELYVVGFTPALLDAFRREHDRAPVFARAPHQTSIGSARRWGDRLGQVPNAADAAAVEQQLLSLLDELASQEEPPHPSPGRRAVLLLLDSPGLRRDELARKLASNRGDVSRSFRREQGLSLSAYRNRLYVLRLMHLLQTGRRNMLHAALEAGFGSYSQCHRVVRGMLGRAPSELRDPQLWTALAEEHEPMATDDALATLPSL